MQSKIVYANIVDIKKQSIYPASIEIKNGKIIDIKRDNNKYNSFILPGFIDAHIHIESSMMPPNEFARVALIHGTIAAVTDPHEIANVLGVEGIEYMINSGKNTPFYFSTGLPSCVPATTFETSGAKIGIKETQKLMPLNDITHLSEVMNVPAVLNNDTEIISKIELAKKYNKPIDGHAPMLRGDDLSKYINSGITTDHEAISYEEAKEKIKKGMKILIREGSAAKNFDALYPLIDEYPNYCMFCSDDLHPNDLLKGHINLLVKKALKKGLNLWNILKCASINPKEHYNIKSGSLNVGDWADFIEVNNLEDFKILKTYIKGEVVATQNRSTIEFIKAKPINNFKANPINSNQLKVKNLNKAIRVIQAFDKELITKELTTLPLNSDPYIQTNLKEDILKIVVLNRYKKNAEPAIGFIKGFGLKKGAIASSIAHDSHNIIAVGVNDDLIVKAINKVIKNRGGISAVYDNIEKILPLEIAGLMSNKEGIHIAKEYEELENIVKKELKTALQAPYMTLAFMALLVIPELKLSDKGLFESKIFNFVSIYKDS